MQIYSLSNQHVHVYMIILAVCWCEKKSNNTEHMRD